MCHIIPLRSSYLTIGDPCNLVVMDKLKICEINSCAQRNDTSSFSFHDVQYIFSSQVFQMYFEYKLAHWDLCYLGHTQRQKFRISYPNIVVCSVVPYQKTIYMMKLFCCLNEKPLWLARMEKFVSSQVFHVDTVCIKVMFCTSYFCNRADTFDKFDKISWTMHCF